MRKEPLIILTGPTAVGKTALSVRLAQLIGAEIVSADSMQVYKRMDIGTAKIRPEEMGGIAHYLIDVLEPSREYNVARFQQDAKDAVRSIHARGKIPIIAGGTGFYIQALLYDIDFSEEPENEIRAELETLAGEKGEQYLYEMLVEADPDSAKIIHPHNRKRVIRALEYFRINGRPISAHNCEQREKESPYRFVYFVLSDDRTKLYERIDRRVDQMLSDGLVQEVRSLLDEGLDRNLTSMQGLGYKEIAAYLAGECTLEEAVYILKRDTRHFAKRQLTWFKRERDVTWLNREDYRSEDEILARMAAVLKEKGIVTDF
ncbi:tRNA (adenosine(37)-N6)-dimethylallyltransferase MiaA [Anaerolentibacter hominis]|uniref:tRNA (adenosine(37)-N6)-dimethylallyltransferase MiaA n=1 Tax=Anaerolentibacter hominis TaxID=3079009 RepID=UPI0031B8558B